MTNGICCPAHAAEKRRLTYDEMVPTVAGTADRLRPYLTLLADKGWPGLSERDRADMTNLRADLEAAFERTLR